MGDPVLLYASFDEEELKYKIENPYKIKKWKKSAIKIDDVFKNKSDDYELFGMEKTMSNVF